MKKSAISLLLAAALCFSCAPEKKSLETVFREINDEVLKNARGYDDLEEATKSIGHRLTGSANGSKAEEFTFNLFRKYGYEDVQYQPFETECWARGSVSLAVQGADSTVASPEVVTLAHSPLRADVDARLIYVRSGLREQFEAVRDSVKGKVVLANVGLEPADSGKTDLHRSEKAALAEEFGAAGIILFNKVEGRILLTGTASVTGDLIPIPAVSIAWEDGQKLKAALAGGAALTVRITMENTSEKIRARNVVATLPGSDRRGEVIVIGGHLDSWDLATGAIDNGIGSFSVIDIARTFKALNLQCRRTIRFVMFMGEEQGLFGSEHMVETLKKEGALGSVRCVINLDMAGNPKGFNWSGREELKDFVVRTGTLIASVDSVYANENGSNPGLHSDHMPFMLEGIASMRPMSDMDHSVYRYYHSNGDHFRLVNRRDMVNNARFAGMFLYALADLDPFPAPRLSDDETRNFFEKHGLKEEMVIGKSWRWGF